MGGIGKAITKVLSTVTGGLIGGSSGNSVTTNIENPVTAAELVPSTASETPGAADINTGSDKKKKGKSALTITTNTGGGSSGGYMGLNI